MYVFLTALLVPIKDGSIQSYPLWVPPFGSASFFQVHRSMIFTAVSQCREWSLGIGNGLLYRNITGMMSQESQPPPASESYTGLGILAGGHKVVKAFGEHVVNRTGNSREGSGTSQVEHLHGVWGRCLQGPEPLFFFVFTATEEETKMNAEVSSLKVQV